MHSLPGMYLLVVPHCYNLWYCCLFFSVTRKQSYNSYVLARSRLRILLLLYRLRSEAKIALLKTTVVLVLVKYE